MSVTLVSGDLSPDLARAMRAAGRVAVDTETSGLHWATDSLQLCQLFTDETGPVLLSQVEGRPVELARLLADPEVAKVFHFAPFDLRFLEAHWGVPAVSIQCTKAASRLLDPELPASEHSLQTLLERHLGVRIEKGGVRTSDWGVATLTDEQIAYATADVDQLLVLDQILTSRLEAAGKAELFVQVCAYMPVDAHLDVSGLPNPLVY